MKGTRHLGAIWILPLLGMLWAQSAFALPPFSRYGPACQWIRLVGQIERPAALPPEETLLLTVTYRMSRRKHSSSLLTNHPLARDDFRFVLSGFREKIDGVIFLEPGFWFSRSIEFQYFATTPDRRWKSPWGRSVYRPVRLKKGGESLCQTEITLGPLALEAR